jgi:hypothetical protein
MARKKSNHPLRLWLRTQDITPAEFARDPVIQCHRSYLTHVIHGRRKPDALLKRIAKRTGIPFEMLRSWAA